MTFYNELGTISVIIPTLNRCFLLQRAIQSVLNQSYKPNEIIVIDNGSSDDTKKTIQTLYPNIRYLTEDKIGVSAARNKGIINARSEWIAFLDSDDVWKPEKLEKQLILNFEFKNKYRFIHTNEIWFRNGVFLNQMKKHEKSGGNLFNKCLKLCCISPSSSLIKKKIFDEYGLFDEDLKVCEDYDMWLRLTSKENVGYVSQPLVVKYGGHSDQLSQKYWGMDRFRIQSIEKNIKNKCFSKDQNKLAYEMLIKKLKIVIKGANKRSNSEIFDIYSNKLSSWLSVSDSFLHV
jgi:glycosyltransferase involved in cell wall biosynthesis